MGALKGIRWQVLVVALAIVAGAGYSVYASRGAPPASESGALASGIAKEKVNVVIKDEMTLGEVAAQAKLEPAVLAEALKIPPEGAGNMKLKDLALLYGFSMEAVREAVVAKAGDCIETCKVE